MSLHRDMDGCFYVHPSNSMSGKVGIDSTKDMNSAITVTQPNKEYLESTVTVIKDSIMNGIIDIVETHIKDDSITPVKDAFVRDGQPVFNYGTTQDLLVGRHHIANELYRSFIEFDPIDLPKDITITEAHIRLRTSNLVEFVPNLQLYAADSYWSEQGITWSNQPLPTEIVAEITEPVVGQQYIQFDITHIANNWKDGKGYQYGFLLVSDDEDFGQYKRFFSRESGYTPELVFKYYDNNPASYGGVTVNCTVKVGYPENDDLNSCVEVFRYEGEEDLNSTIYARIQGEIQSQVYASAPDLDSTIFVAETNDIDSIVTVAGHELEDLESVLRLSKDFIDSTVVVQRHDEKDLDSSFVAKRHEDNDLESTIIVLQPYLDSTVEVTRFLNLDSTVFVNRDGETDLQTLIGVKKEVMDSTVEVHLYKDLDGTVFINRNEEKDLNSTITVKRESDVDLESIIEVTWKDDLNSTVSVFVSKVDELNSCVTVINHKDIELDSIIQVTKYKDLPSTIFVLQNDLPSTIVVLNEDDKGLNSIIHVDPANDLDGTIDVTNFKDLKSQLMILLPYFHDVLGSIEVMEQGALESVVSVIRANLDSTIEVLPTSELESTLEVHYLDDLDSRFYILYPSGKDLLSTLEVMEQGALDSLIGVKRSKLHSTVIITNSELRSQLLVVKRNLDSTVSVLNSSLDSSLQVNRSILESTLLVHKPEIDSVINVRGVDEKDLDSVFIIPEEDGFLESTIAVYTSNIMQGRARFDLIKDPELDSTLEVQIVKEIDLYSTILVSPHNKMEGKVDIVKPDPVTGAIYPIRDAFVRSQRPYMNFGDTTDLYIGKMSTNNELFRSFIYFELGEDLPQEIEFIEAKLVLTNLTLNNMSTDIELYEVDSQWYEMGITWENQPKPLNYITSVSGTSLNGSIIEFDLMSIINEWHSGERIKHGFLIKLKDEDVAQTKRVFAREGSYPPRLHLKYYDLSIKNNHLIDVPSTVNVFVNDDTDLNSSLYVEDYQRADDLDSTLEVEKIYDLDSEVRIKHDNLHSTFYVIESEYLPSTVNVENELIGQLNSIVRSNKPFIDSTLIVIRHEHNDLISTIGVLYPRNNDWNSTVNVLNEDKQDLDSTLRVIKSGMDSTIEVTRKEDLDSTVSVFRNEYIDIDSHVEVTLYRDLSSTIEVRTTWLDSTVTVGKEDESEIDSHLRVRPTKDLPSIVRVSYEKDLESTFFVYKEEYEDLYSEVEVIHSDDLDSVVTVLREGFNDLDSTIYALEPVVKDLLSTVIIGGNDRSDLGSTLHVPHQDLDSTIEVEEVGNRSLNSTVLVLKYDDLDGAVIVLKHHHEEIDSTIEVTHCKDLESIIHVMKFNDIDSIVQVLSPMTNDLHSTIVVDEEIDDEVIGYVFIF